MMDLLLKPELRSARAVRLRELFCSLFGVCITDVMGWSDA